MRVELGKVEVEFEIVGSLSLIGSGELGIRPAFLRVGFDGRHFRSLQELRLSEALEFGILGEVFEWIAEIWENLKQSGTRLSLRVLDSNESDALTLAR